MSSGDGPRREPITVAVGWLKIAIPRKNGCVDGAGEANRDDVDVQPNTDVMTLMMMFRLCGDEEMREVESVERWSRRMVAEAGDSSRMAIRLSVASREAGHAGKPPLSTTRRTVLRQLPSPIFELLACNLESVLDLRPFCCSPSCQLSLCLSCAYHAMNPLHTLLTHTLSC